MLPETNPIIKDNTIVRRLFKFFRTHKIEYKQEDGIFYLGSGVCRVVNGSVSVHFPMIGRCYGNHISFQIEFDDCWNTYLKLSRRHNQIITAFPLALTKYLPDLFD